MLADYNLSFFGQEEATCSAYLDMLAKDTTRVVQKDITRYGGMLLSDQTGACAKGLKLRPHRCAAFLLRPAYLFAYSTWALLIRNQCILFRIPPPLAGGAGGPTGHWRRG